jgi:hypothetical protein
MKAEELKGRLLVLVTQEDDLKFKRQEFDDEMAEAAALLKEQTVLNEITVDFDRTELEKERREKKEDASKNPVPNHSPCLEFPNGGAG